MENVVSQDYGIETKFGFSRVILGEVLLDLKHGIYK